LENSIGKAQALLPGFSKGDAMEEEQSFTPGEMVEILDGPFTKYIGKVSEVNNDKRMLAVEVNDESGILLGKNTIELRFREVKRRPDILPR
jgi:transcription antitermination factor NusG